MLQSRSRAFFGIAICALLLLIAGILVSYNQPETLPEGTTIGHGDEPSGGLTAITNDVAVGKVIATDGVTLRIKGISGSLSVVHTTENTRVVMLGGSHVSDITIGSPIVVHGDKTKDGSMLANLIMSSSFGFMGI